MAHTYRGEVEVEVGLGLPRTTTTNRLAYTPSNAGYAVFDTDLQQIATWDGTTWLLSTAGDKIDTTNGVAKETFVIDSDVNTGSIVVTAGTGGSPAVDGTAIGSGRLSPNYLSSPYTISADGRTILGSYSDFPTTFLGNEDTRKSSGKWYWELVDQDAVDTTVGNSRLRTGIVKLPWDLDRTPTSTDVSEQVYVWFLFDSGLLRDGYEPVQADNSASAYNARGWWFDGPGSTVITFKLDLDAQTIEIQPIGKPSAVMSLASTSAGTYAPFVTFNYDRSPTFNFKKSDLVGTLPAGYQTFEGDAATNQTFTTDGAPSTVKVTENALVVSHNDGPSLSLSSGDIVASTHIIGVDDANPASYVTRNYTKVSTGYLDSFAVADWSVVGNMNVLTIPQTTHDRPFVSGSAYRVVVSELVGVDRYARVHVPTFTNSNGDVVVETDGAPFDGSISISL